MLPSSSMPLVIKQSQSQRKGQGLSALGVLTESGYNEEGGTVWHPQLLNDQYLYKRGNQVDCYAPESKEGMNNHLQSFHGSQTNTNGKTDENTIKENFRSQFLKKVVFHTIKFHKFDL